MEEVINFTPDALIELLSYIDPCKLAVYLSVNKNIARILESSDALYKFAKDRKLPYHRGVTTLEELCKYHGLKTSGKLSSYISYIGAIEDLELTLSEDGSDYGSVIDFASGETLMETISIVLRRAKENNLPIFFILAYDDHFETIEKILDLWFTETSLKYTEILNEILRGAAAGDHQDEVKLYIKRGADDYTGAYISAMGNLHKNTSEFIAKSGRVDLLQVLLHFINNDAEEHQRDINQKNLKAFNAVLKYYDQRGLLDKYTSMELLSKSRNSRDIFESLLKYIIKIAKIQLDERFIDYLSLDERVRDIVKRLI